MIKQLSKPFMVAFLLLSLVLISGCVQQTKSSQLDVRHNCDGLVCSLEVVDEDVLNTTNLLGKTQQCTLETCALNDSQDKNTHIQWSSKDGKGANNSDLVEDGLTPCQNGKCTDTANPTGFQADGLGSKIVHVEGYLTRDNGQKEYIDRDVTLNITTGNSAEIVARPTYRDSLKYRFSINRQESGIPLDSTYQWFIDDKPISTNDRFTHEFNAGVKKYKVKVIITPNNVSILPILLEKTISISILPATIDSEVVKNEYIFTANKTNTGLPPTGVTYNWSSGGEPIGSGSSIKHLFIQTNRMYKISLKTKINDNNTVGITNKYIYVGDDTSANLSLSQDGANPLAWTVTANTTGTNINSNWSRKWYIDNKVVSGATSDTFKHTFEFTAHKYTVKYIATGPKEIKKRESSIVVNTLAAKNPTLSKSAGSSDSTFDLKANLTDTGITDKWTYKWKSNPSATFTDYTAKDTSVSFQNSIAYKLTFTAKPPKGSKDTAKTASITIDLSQHPTSATYLVPESATKTAPQFATEFAAYTGGKANVASVKAVGNNQLTFTCKPGFHITKAAANLLPWPDYGLGIVFNGDGYGTQQQIVWIAYDKWQTTHYEYAVNNSNRIFTGLGCIPN